MNAGVANGEHGWPEGAPAAERLPAAHRDDLAYARFVAQLRVLETRLLTRSQLQRLVEAPDVETAFRQLGESEYGPAVAAAGGAAAYEAALSAELVRVFAVLRENAPEPELVQVLGIAYDWQNLKTVIKAMLTGKPLEPRNLVAAGNLSPQSLLALAAGGSLVALPAPYREPALRAAAAFGAAGDPQDIDLILDAARYLSILERARAWRYELLAEQAQAAADMVNLRTLLRLKLLRASTGLLERALVPGGTIPTERLVAMLPLELEEMAAALAGGPFGDVFAAGVAGYRQSASLGPMEKLMDDRLLRLMSGARLIALGPEPVIAYVLAKETEIKNLRIIFTGKLNRLPDNTIRERLRETYA